MAQPELVKSKKDEDKIIKIPSGEDVKKAPGLLKSNANHFYNNAHSARPGAYTLCRAVSIFVVIK